MSHDKLDGQINPPSPPSRWAGGQTITSLSHHKDSTKISTLLETGYDGITPNSKVPLLLCITGWLSLRNTSHFTAKWIEITTKCIQVLGFSSEVAFWIYKHCLRISDWLLIGICLKCNQLEIHSRLVMSLDPPPLFCAGRWRWGWRWRSWWWWPPLGEAESRNKHIHKDKVSATNALLVNV